MMIGAVVLMGVAAGFAAVDAGFVAGAAGFVTGVVGAAGFAVGAGLPYEDAWRAITINPARDTGIGDRVGSLEVGKDGDVVIWTADPLTKIGAEAYVTVVDGKVVYNAER